MEIRFIAPGSLVCNLDFVESIFGNGGDPLVPENDAALDTLYWSGHTGCVILAPHLIFLKKKDVGLPHWDVATERQRADRMCWRDPEELYNDGQAFKLTFRTKHGIIITLIAISTMLLPVLGLVMGANDLPTVLAAESPFAAFIAQRASPTVAIITSLAIASAIFNANLAGIICYGRFAYSSGRNHIWSQPINTALVRLHPRLNSPWVATLAVGVFAMAFCFLGLRALIIVAAALGIVGWTGLNLGGLIGRRRNLTGRPGAYRAPLYPLTHILSFVGAAWLAVLAWRDTETGRPGEFFVIGLIIAALLYHQFVLARRPGGWTMTNPSDADQTEGSVT